MFLVLMVVGLVGLVMMAIPAFARHGGGHAAHGPAHTHGIALGKGGGRLLGVGSRGGAAAAPGSSPNATDAVSEVAIPPDVRSTSLVRFIPSPRAVCSVLALYGAFANALERAAGFPVFLAALAAVVPALLVEWLVIRPVWNLVFRFQGRETSPLEELVLAEACAVVPFRNGRGLVSTVRDGRAVQLMAELSPEDAAIPVKVGDTLRIEDVDARRERVTVSVIVRRE